jgi:cytoskeletal protein RodZ
MLTASPDRLSVGVWNNGFSCQPMNNRARICCGPENRRECCFADQMPQRANVLSLERDSSSANMVDLTINKQISSAIITPASYTLILVAIVMTLFLLIVLLMFFIYLVRRKLKRSSSSSSSSSSFDKPSQRLSVTMASSSKSGASSPVPSTYADYWSRTMISPSDWTSAKPYTSFIGGHPMNNYNYYTDQYT